MAVPRRKARAREPAIDLMQPALPEVRGLRQMLWEALTAASHRAQEVEPGMPPGSAEPVEK